MNTNVTLLYKLFLLFISTFFLNKYLKNSLKIVVLKFLKNFFKNLNSYNSSYKCICYAMLCIS